MDRDSDSVELSSRPERNDRNVAVALVSGWAAGHCLRGIAQARSAAPLEADRRECNRAAPVGPPRSA